MSQPRYSKTLSKEEIEKLTKKKTDEAIAEVQDRGISGSEYRRIRRELEYEQTKGAAASDWFRAHTRAGHHHWKTVTWTIGDVWQHQGTIKNSWKYVNQKPKPYVRIAIIIGLFSVIGLIIVNQTEALGLGGWLQNNGYYIVVGIIIIFAFYWISRRRAQRREQEMAP